MFGFINLHKPQGWTSHDCVAKVRRLLTLKRVGHGGTLDPLATGVLPIAIGPATRLLQFLPTQKAYRATIRLGVITSTDDLAGEVLQTHSTQAVTLAQVTHALQSFRGTLQQVPPIYSAIQINGQRLYKLARQGEAVQLEPRTIEIYSIEVLDWQSNPKCAPECAEVTLQIECGPGTYIRSIARDLGKVLQTGGTLAQLIRTQSCGFNLEDSISLDLLAQKVDQGSFCLTDPTLALRHMPSVELNELAAMQWCQGQAVAIKASTTDWVRVYNPAAKFLGVGFFRDEFLVPKVVLSNEISREYH